MISNMLNHAGLQGRLVKEAELRTTTNGKSVTTFTLAVERDKEHTYFVDCVAWEKTAENISRFCKTGDMIIIEGMLTTRNYEDKNGNKKKATEILVDCFHFVPKGKPDEKPNITIEEDDIPW